MRILGTMIRTLIVDVLSRQAEGSNGDVIGPEFIGCDPGGWPALFLQQLAALVDESELARNEPDSQVHHLPRAYDDGLPSSAIRLRM